MAAMDNMLMLLRIGGEADAALASKANEVQPAYACMMSAHEYVLIFFRHAHEYVLACT